MEWLRGTLSVDSRMRTIRIGFPVCWSCVEQVGTPVQVLMCCVRSWIDWNWKQVLYYSSSLSLSTTRSGVSVIAKCKVLQMLQSALFAGIWTPDASKSGGKKGNSQSWGNVASQLLFWGFITVEGYPWNPVSTFIHLHLHTNTHLFGWDLWRSWTIILERGALVHLPHLVGKAGSLRTAVVAWSPQHVAMALGGKWRLCQPLNPAAAAVESVEWQKLRVLSIQRKTTKHWTFSTYTVVMLIFVPTLHVQGFTYGRSEPADAEGAREAIDYVATMCCNFPSFSYSAPVMICIIFYIWLVLRVLYVHTWTLANASTTWETSWATNSCWIHLIGDLWSRIWFSTSW